MPTTIGQKVGTRTQHDTNLALAAGGGWVAGTSWDAQADATTGTLWERTNGQFSITNPASPGTDGYDVDVMIQFSADNSTWPALGQGTFVANYYSATAGDDLSLSGAVPVGVLARYPRFIYRDNNATDGLTVSSWSQEEAGATYP